MQLFLCFGEKFILFEQIFIWPKDILFELNKCYLIQINLLLGTRNALQTNDFPLFS